MFYSKRIAQSSYYILVNLFCTFGFSISKPLRMLRVLYSGSLLSASLLSLTNTICPDYRVDHKNQKLFNNFINTFFLLFLFISITNRISASLELIWRFLKRLEIGKYFRIKIWFFLFCGQIFSKTLFMTETLRWSQLI